jgi:hypothetical protein
MKGILISPDDEVKVKFALGRLKTGVMVGDTTAEMMKKTFGDDLDESTVEEHEAVFRRPNFGDTVAIAGEFHMNDNGIQVNPLAIRQARMARLIKSWTLKDDEKDIPANQSSIYALDPLVANMIGIQLDTATAV